jgi:hypothetical protein
VPVLGAREQALGQGIEAPLADGKFLTISRVVLEEEGVDPVHRRIADHQLRPVPADQHVGGTGR